MTQEPAKSTGLARFTEHLQRRSDVMSPLNIGLALLMGFGAFLGTASGRYLAHGPDPNLAPVVFFVETFGAWPLLLLSFGLAGLAACLFDREREVDWPWIGIGSATFLLGCAFLFGGLVADAGGAVGSLFWSSGAAWIGRFLNLGLGLAFLATAAYAFGQAFGFDLGLKPSDSEETEDGEVHIRKRLGAAASAVAAANALRRPPADEIEDAVFGVDLVGDTGSIRPISPSRSANLGSVRPKSGGDAKLIASDELLDPEVRPARRGAVVARGGVDSAVVDPVERGAAPDELVTDELVTDELVTDEPAAEQDAGDASAAAEEASDSSATAQSEAAGSAAVDLDAQELTEEASEAVAETEAAELADQAGATEVLEEEVEEDADEEDEDEDGEWADGEWEYVDEDEEEEGEEWEEGDEEAAELDGDEGEWEEEDDEDGEEEGEDEGEWAYDDEEEEDEEEEEVAEELEEVAVAPEPAVAESESLAAEDPLSEYAQAGLFDGSEESDQAAGAEAGVVIPAAPPKTKAPEPAAADGPTAVEEPVAAGGSAKRSVPTPPEVEAPELAATVAAAATGAVAELVAPAEEPASKPATAKDSKPSSSPKKGGKSGKSSKAKAGGKQAPKPKVETPEDFEALVYESGRLFLEEQRVAVSMLQKAHGLDFKRSTAILDQLQERGLIGPYVGGHSREILMTAEEWRDAQG